MGKKRELGRGNALEELVKGSLVYTLYAIRRAFRNQFPELRWDYWVEEPFEDYVIVKNDELPMDEFYYVTYERDGDGYVFADRQDWEVVSLTYTLPAPMEESRTGKGERLVEWTGAAVRLLDEAEDKPDGPWRIKAVGITADVVNANERRYPGAVLDAAVHVVRTHLHESAGQGRVRQIYAEAEHPSEKPSRRASLPEVVINWDKVVFDGRQTLIEGNLLGTAAGKDIRAQMLGGVVPGISQRAYGEGHVVEESGQEFLEVDWVVITGYDLTVEPSDPQAEVTMFESKKNQEEVDEMKLNLDLLREKYPALVRQIEESHDEEQKQKLEEALAQKLASEAAIQELVAAEQTGLREVLALGATDDLTATVTAQKVRLGELEEAEGKRKVSEFVEAEVGKVKGYPTWLRKELAAAVTAAGPSTVDEATQVIVGKRKEYDGIMAQVELKVLGHDGGVQVMGAVLERETGTPGFAVPAYQLQESLRKHEMVREWNPKKPLNVNQRVAAKMLARFDERFGHFLRQEARTFEEAEQTSDLNLPYSVARAIVAEAYPMLVATSIFDVSVMTQNPSRIYFEAFAGETGHTVAVTDEAATSDEDVWVALDNQRLTSGTIVITGAAGSPTYVEYTDYLVDIANGKFYTLSTGSIGDGTTLEVDYTYTAMRKGEMAAIQRGKATLSFETVDAAADRLAQQISKEAVVFSRSQLNYDATAQTLMMLVRDVRKAIDAGLLYLASSVVATVANNSGGSWNQGGGDTLDELVEMLGVAKVKVENRWYEPTYYIASNTNADTLSNWDGFKRDGFPNAELMPNGFVGRVKGLPLFKSTEFTDAKIVVGHRELVQHRVYEAMVIEGPFPSYDTNGKLIAANQYYTEEFNATVALVPEKGASVTII